MDANTFNENPYVFIFPNGHSVTIMSAFLQKYAREVKEVDFRGVTKCADSDKVDAHNEMFKVFNEAKLEHVMGRNRSLSKAVMIGNILKDSLVALNIFSQEADIKQETLSENLLKAKLKKINLTKMILCKKW